MELIEKVKQGLRCIARIGECDCDHCDYADNGYPSVLYKCQEKFASDALSVIESLQSENKILSENCDGLSKQLDDFAQTIHEQEMEIERLKAEVEKAREEGFKDGQHNVFECMNAGW